MEESKETLEVGDGESVKPGLKLYTQKTKIMASGPITACKQMGKK